MAQHLKIQQNPEENFVVKDEMYIHPNHKSKIQIITL